MATDLSDYLTKALEHYRRFAASYLASRFQIVILVRSTCSWSLAILLESCDCDGLQPIECIPTTRMIPAGYNALRVFEFDFRGLNEAVADT